MTDASGYEYCRHHRAKYVRITVYPGGRVRVTVPRRATWAEARAFVSSKRDWIKERQRELAGARDTTPFGIYTREHYLAHREAARSLITNKLEHWNAQYGFRYGDIRIKSQRTCWGSCSSRGNLNFNYKIMFLPEDLQDYIIVHELCHLAVMNHGPRFWQLVARTIPDHRERRQQLSRLVRGRVD